MIMTLKKCSILTIVHIYMAKHKWMIILRQKFNIAQNKVITSRSILFRYSFYRERDNVKCNKIIQQNSVRSI